jgi:hypothetical protein
MSVTGHSNGRTKQLQNCHCGCSAAPWHRLHLLRGPDNHSYFVLDGCREAFGREVQASWRLKTLVEAVKGLPCWERWRFAKLFFMLILALHTRHNGQKVALMTARRSAFLFVTPAWIGLRVARFWKVKAA